MFWSFIMFYLILIIYCFTNVLSLEVLKAIEIFNLTDNQMISLRNTDLKQRLDIFCSFGQKRIISNALMSSHFILSESPQHFRVFTSRHLTQYNETEIVRHFKRLWSQTTSWLDSTPVTSIDIPSFSFHCIAITSNESFKCQLLVQRVNNYRFVSLIIGLILYIFGPKISRSVLFYYISCISLGVFASFLIIFFIINRYFPRKISGIVLMLGSSAVVFAFRIFFNSLLQFFIIHKFYVFIYILSMAFISFGLSYRFGPITHDKTLNLMQWSLQFIGLVFIAISTQLYEYSSALTLSIFIWKLIPIKHLFTFKRKKRIEMRLLSETEFEQQSDVHTREALERLKIYCLSSECNAWKTMSKLKDPIRFANFINGENHISDQEIIFYERNGLIQLNNEDIDSTDDEYQDLD